MKTLYPYQEEGVNFLTTRRAGLLFDDMGLGKTCQAIEAMKRLKVVKGVVVCPLAVRHQWIKNIQEQYPGVFINEIKTKRDKPVRNAINVVHYDIVWRSPLVRHLKCFMWDVVIFDEAHFLKNWNSRRTISLLGRDGMYNYGRYIWCLTGTPILNRPIELYPILRGLAPTALGKYAEYNTYAKYFCNAYYDAYNKFNVNGAAHLNILASIIKPLYLRRTKSEVLQQLPEITYEKIYTDSTEKIIRANSGILKETEDVLSLQRMLGIIKTPITIEHIRDVLETKGKVVVFTVHKDVATNINIAFKECSVMYTGDETSTEKAAAVAKFINDKDCKVFIGNIKASGFGIDGLQKVCDIVIFAEISYVPGEIRQAVDRIHRIGQNRRVLVQFIITENSMEEQIIDKLTAKSNNIGDILQEGGMEGFVEVQCYACKNRIKIKNAVRIGKVTVCGKCLKEMEILL